MKKLKLKDLHSVLAPMPADIRKGVAAAAKTSPAMLAQYTSGHRSMSAAKAALVEEATGVPRESLCAACGACDLAKIARGVQADRAAKVPR